MKVTLNLSTTPGLRERWALAWAIPATLVGLAGLLFVLTSTARAFRDYRTVHKSLRERLEQENRLSSREAALRKELEQPQVREVLHQVQVVNALIEKKQISLIDLVGKVTELLPGQARLTGLALVPQGDNLLVRFAVGGRDEEEVETFLSKLEDSPDFKDVAVISQGEGERAGSDPVTVSCSARYVAGAR
jgi:hypothetical protein